MTPPPRTKNGEQGPSPIGRFSVIVLLSAFVLIASGFIASAIFGEVQASAIDEEVAGIESNSLPSVEHLTAASTALRQLEIEADQYVEQSPADREHERRTAYSARRDLDRELSSYLTTPMYPGERAQYDEVDHSLVALDRALAELYELAARDQPRARAFADEELRVAVQEADHALRNLTARNAGELHNEVTRIAGVRHRTIRIALLLDSVCVIFSVVAAIVAIRALRRQRAVEVAHERMLEGRANELELFAKRVAHDLLSPLSALAFTLSSVRRNVERGDSIADPLARANACLRRSQRLVDGILDFARAGTTPALAGHADLRESIDGVLDEARSDETARVEIVTEPFDDVEVACSVGVLASILSNLVRNAVKYMGDRGERRITVRVTSDETRVHVEVEDTGPGLAPGLEGHVFEPYVRAPENIQPGLGLGLSTVRRFAEAHGGRVGVHSFPGRGCVFWFELPRVAGRASVAPPSERHPVILQ